MRQEPNWPGEGANSSLAELEQVHRGRGMFGLMRWISAPSVVRAIRVAAGHGVEQAPLWALAGLEVDEPHPPSVRVSEERLYAVFEAIARSLRDSGFPVSYARASSLDGLDALGLAIKSARTAREALHVLSRFHRYWTDTSTWELREQGSDVALEFRRDGPRRLGMRLANEAAVGEWVHATRELLGSGFAPDRVHFRHAAPSPLDEHREFFSCELVFDSSFDGVEFPAHFLETEMPGANAELSRMLRGFMEQRLYETDELEVKLRSAIARALPSGLPLMSSIAKDLGMSERTLARRLADAGTTFQRSVERVRLELAQQFLAAPRYGVGEVAFLLGYSETSAFSRAFKRWTGESPVAFRKTRGA